MAQYLFLQMGVVLLFLSLDIGTAFTRKDHAASFRTGSVYCRNRECQFKTDLDWDAATVVGTFNDTLLITGWGILDLSAGHSTNATFSNEDIMYGAGFLEGVFTAHQMESHFINMKKYMLGKGNHTALKNWFVKQRAWSDMMVMLHSKDSPQWRMMGYILAQLDGLYAGYKMVRPNNDAVIDMYAINFLNGVGDLIDLIQVLYPKTIPDWTKFSPEEARNYFYTRGHCSALIKLTAGFEDIFMSHSSWFTFSATNRIFKHYDFNLDDTLAVGKKMSFSSYPGFLESLDDFYLIGSGLVMLQTTISVFDSSLYSKVHPESLLAWQRVRLANLMARNGEEWTEILKKYNSGTYNNEYMIIDLNRFQPKKPLPDGTLWVANQMPGLVVAADATNILRAGYFPSYNVPFFEEIFNLSGQAAYAKKHGSAYSYDLAARGEIFRRDAGKVNNMEDMKAIMRYSDYKNDPYGKGSPFFAICGRGDLVGTPDGCYDTKVSNFTMARTFQADIINGPTQSHGLPPFKWASFPGMSHVGLPPVYDFPFLRTKPGF